MRYIVSAILILAAASPGLAQSADNLSTGRNPKGKVRSETWERTLVFTSVARSKGEKYTVYIDLFDELGRLTQTSTFGNREERTTFDWSGPLSKRNVSYFDLAGNAIAGNEGFVGKATDAVHTGLCSDFTIRRQNNTAERVVYEYEVCRDGTNRATTTTECSPGGHSIRSVREDTLSRSWEITSTYDRDGNLIETNHTINDGKVPKFTQRAVYVSYQFDSYKNWIRRITSNFDSRAHDGLVFQFVDERKITYYDEKSP